MDRSLGAQRIMLAGKLLALIGSTIAFFWWLLTTWNTATPAKIGLLVVDIVPALALGAVIWIAGWVVEGFVRHSNDHE